MEYCHPNASSTFDMSAISAYSLILNWPFVKCHNYSASNDLPIEAVKHRWKDFRHHQSHISSKFNIVQHTAAFYFWSNSDACDIKEQTAEMQTHFCGINLFDASLIGHTCFTAAQKSFPVPELLQPHDSACMLPSQISKGKEVSSVWHQKTFYTGI